MRIIKRDPPGITFSRASRPSVSGRSGNTLNLILGFFVVDGTRTVAGRTVIGRTVVRRTIVGSIVVGIREVFHRERGNLIDGVVSCVENIPGAYVGIGFCC
jgi:hypothetical protein